MPSRTTIMGLGRFGGGLGVTRYLLGLGHHVTLTDTQTDDQLRPQLDLLHCHVAAIAGAVDRLTLRLGEHREEDFAGADLVVASPAVPKPWNNRYLNAARDAGVRITTEINLLVERLPRRDRVVGITGTAGKSTTASMAAHLLAGALRDTGRAVHLGGNIGGSLLNTLDEIHPDDPVVLELSSAQLHWLRDASWTPGLAVTTHFAPNHLDWHGSLEHYEACKRAIIGERLVCPAGAFEQWGSEAGADVRTVDGPSIEAATRWPIPPGRHNAVNAALAIAAADWLLESGERAERVRPDEALRSFASLPHRLEVVPSGRAARFINDSKSTTPEATALAVNAMLEDGATGRVLLIVGGYDKGLDPAPLLEAAARCAHVACVGATGPLLADRLGSAGVAAASHQSLKDAFAALAHTAEPGDVILFSPGHASWDQFPNFEARGEAFRSLVRRHADDRDRV